MEFIIRALGRRRYHFLIGLLLLPTATRAQDLQALFDSNNIAEYQGYRITRTFEKDKNVFGRSQTVVKRGKVVLARIEGYSFENSTRFALFGLLGKGRKQLIVESYSGGGHCCTSYHIYDLGPRFRVLFDGDSYGAEDVGYSMKLIDLNHDGVYEFAQNVMNFDYFHASHASSVFPEVVFAFDVRSNTFRPANRAFSDYLLRDIKHKLAAAEKLNDDLSRDSHDIWLREKYHQAFLDVTLTYIFAGEDRIGWTFFDQKYKLDDKNGIRVDLKTTLRESVIYKTMYRR